MRLFDMIASFVGLLLLGPFFICVAVLIRFDSPGPIIYRSERVGRELKPFQLLKFRTMIVNAAHIGPGITTHEDRRVTRVGRWLRRTKIDELPQLLNVLRGEMSLVGPRPEDPRYVAHYTPQQRRVLAVRPGITSPASLRYRREERLLQGEFWEETYLQQILPGKLAIDLDYLERRTLWTDLSILIQTVIGRSDPPIDPIHEK